MRAGRLAVVLAAFALALVTAASAQELSLSVGAGGLFPSAGQYREIYGSGLSVGAELWLKLKDHLGFAAGFGLLSDKGMAILAGSGNAEYPLSFRRVSVPIVVFYKGHTISPRLVMTASLALMNRISLFCSASYDSIRAGADSALGTTVQIGGFQLLGGLAFRIF
jgi:hypothetical protein